MMCGAVLTTSGQRDRRTETVRACRQPLGRLPGGGAPVGHAVGDPDASEAAAGDEQSWMAATRALDRGHPRQVADLVLRVAAFQRYTRVNSGSPEMPSSGPSAVRASDTSSASDRSSAFGSRAPPTNVRSSTRSSGARCGHFDDSHEAARIPVAFVLGTTKPDPSSGCRTAARGKASATVALETYETPSHKRASSASTSRMRRPATYAGAARTSERAVNVSPDRFARERVASPTVTAPARRWTRKDPCDRRVQPNGRRRHCCDERADHFAQPARQRAKQPFSVHRPVPLSPARSGGCRRKARSRLPWARSASTNRGNSARTESRSTSPA